MWTTSVLSILWCSWNIELKTYCIIQYNKYTAAKKLEAYNCNFIKMKISYTVELGEKKKIVPESAGNHGNPGGNDGAR